MSFDAVVRACHAKVNLALAVGPPIAGNGPNAGLHPICTWMASIDLADHLRIERADNHTRYHIRWHTGQSVDWDLETDLCVKAHRALERHLARTLPVEIELEKRIPAGGGLGGGSSDAAGTLLALNALFELGLDQHELRAIASGLGSDIAYFIDDASPPAPAIVSGLGEHIERLDRRSIPLVLICPPFECSTAAVYRACDRLGPKPLDETQVRNIALRGSLDELFNDLSPAADVVEPRLVELRRCIASTAKVSAHLSGSGSTLFVPGGRDLAEVLRRALPDCRVFETTTL